MSKEQALDSFLDKTKTLYEPEYGDFKRKVGQYINRLEREWPEPTEESLKVFDEMRNKLLFGRSRDPDRVRSEMISMSLKLR